MKCFGIFVYDDVEVMDFTGPFEVFRNISKLSDNEIHLFTVANEKREIDAQGLSINPTYSFNDCPTMDFLVIPGGDGRKISSDDSVLNWVKEQFDQGSAILTVCTGALVPAKLGLLSEKNMTTHHLYFDYLKEIAPNGKVVKDDRFVDNGNIVMSGGISAGIDMALHIVEREYSAELAEKIAEYMEYKTR
ncbi:MAG: DJ-1/PfpI family protein [Candidatus Kariarchaeaceae archaeon]|jgi:transcriptional regulator GlxA family with amidase domain